MTYFSKCKCLGCGKDFCTISNRKPVSIRDACCSDECAKKYKEWRISKKERHYEVFKDKRYYYIKTDGGLTAKRSLSGAVNYAIKSHIHILDKKTKELTSTEKVPEDAVKIIDKHEKYLYTEKDSFDKWKNRK